MRYVLLTGMARSGTTLLDKLLGNSPGGAMASQPLALLFIELKKAFYEAIGHPEDYYVLNHLFDEERYEPGDLAEFLLSYRCSAEMLYRVLSNEGHYSGQYRRYSNPAEWAAELSGHAPAKTIELLLGKVFPGDYDFLGLKEIYIEEFIPYFLAEGWSCAAIVRDPRDVLASMNLGKGSEYTGTVKPTLFNLRNWRKSVRLWSMTEVHGLQFETLVEHTEAALSELLRELSGREAPKKWVPEQLNDEYGNPWRSNSSFGQAQSDAGPSKRKLTLEQQRFIEAYTFVEMQRLGYTPRAMEQQPAALEDLPLSDPFEVTDERLLRLYSDAEAERRKEWSYRNR